MSVSNWPCETTLPTSDDVKSTHNSDPLFFKLSRRNISQDTTAPFLKLVFTIRVRLFCCFFGVLLYEYTQNLKSWARLGTTSTTTTTTSPIMTEGWEEGDGGGGETIQGFISEGGKVSLTRGHHTMTLHFRYLQVSLFAE